MIASEAGGVKTFEEAGLYLVDGPRAFAIAMQALKATYAVGPRPLLTADIEDLEITIRAARILKDAGINTIGRVGRSVR